MNAALHPGASRYGEDAISTPGLYIDWRPQGLAGRRLLPTGVPVFAGFVKPGAFPPGEAHARQFDRWARFETAYRQAQPSELLACAVHGFFQNGGERCIVQPVAAELKPVQPDRELARMRAFQLAGLLTAPFSETGALRDLEYVDLVCVPDAMTPEILAVPEHVFDVQRQIVEYCARTRDRFAILDAMPADGLRAGFALDGDTAPETSRDPLIDAITQWQTLPADHGALYFPWVLVKSAMGDGAGQRTVRVPPCGHIAGVYARSDRRTGVHKAPANELLEGVLDVDVRVRARDQDELNAAGVNCLREWPGRGLRVWGARTLSDRAELRYVNVTRLVLTLTRELERNLRDLVFEPHNGALWAAIEDRVRVVLRRLFERGALKGADASQAYYVKCNAETNPFEQRDAGVLVAQIGLAVHAPAEFVIVRITQSASGVTVSGPTTQA